MKALIFDAVRQVRCATVPDPAPLGAGDVVVRVGVAAICGSDLHVYRGAEAGLDVGTVLGHEMAGEVVAVGPSVRRFRPGDLVVSPFTTSCGGRCFYCVSGLTARCVEGQLFGWVQEGRGLHGVQAEYARVPLADSTLVAVPAGVPLEAALFTGDVLATGWYAAEAGGAGPGVVVAVLGCGPVGLMAVLAARELGAERIFAIDALPARLRLAERFGAEPLDLAREPVAAVREATGGRGADAVLEAVGSPESTRLAYELARPGGTIAAVGVHTEARFALAPGEIYDKNLTYRAGRAPVRLYMERLLPLARDRAADLAALVSHRLPLGEGPRGYDLFDRRLEGCTKVILLP